MQKAYILTSKDGKKLFMFLNNPIEIDMDFLRNLGENTCANAGSFVEVEILSRGGYFDKKNILERKTFEYNIRIEVLRTLYRYDPYVAGVPSHIVENLFTDSFEHLGIKRCYCHRVYMANTIKRCLLCTDGLSYEEMNPVVFETIPVGNKEENKE